MLFSFFLYLGIGFSLGPEFLYQDIRKKFFAFADDTIVVTAVVLGPPAVPMVTATPACVAGAARTSLDWADDTGSTSFSIDRDSSILTTGLITSGYTDVAVASNTAYTYQVTAYGPMGPGIALSAMVNATTLDCAAITPVTAQIETLGGKNVVTDRSGVSLSKARPKVTGTTNTPNAIIDILVTNPTIRARITANVNGYFEWLPPIKLSAGNHIIEVIATDPLDSSRTATDRFIFRTKYASGNDRESRADMSEPGPIFDFTITVNNSDLELFQEEELSVTLTVPEGMFPKAAKAELFLNDPSRQNVLRFSDRSPIAGQERMTYSERIPLSLEPGDYRVRADVMSGWGMTSREATFTLKGLPFLALFGREVTYPEAANYLGTFFFSLLFLFLFFLLLFVREYWLSLHSIRGITERQLSRFGFLGKRKGVIR